MLRALGCLFLILLLAGGAFLSRGYWRPLVFGRDSTAIIDASSAWQRLTPEGAQRARVAMERLRAPRGPAFQTVGPGDLAAYILQELSQTLPPSADSIEAAALGDRLLLRARVRVADLGDKGSLGPLSMLLGDRERVQLGGVLRIIRPGYAELQVKEFRIRDLALPQALIPRLIRQMSRGERPAELSPDGLPLRTPTYIGDVRVSDGKITIYKTAQPR
ncbi:MAG TPA: hypothetical protein VEB19_12525 [Gemmatimonadaceae bacterium]|nr:hypothetical protein [Gemmatimonadaceae bacterium]